MHKKNETDKKIKQQKFFKMLIILPVVTNVNTISK